MSDTIKLLAAIQAVNNLPQEMGFVSVDAVKKALRGLGAKEETPFMTCIGCNRDEPVKRDEICCSCLRGGHQTDVDFYSPAPGGAK